MGLLEKYEQKLDDFENGIISFGEFNEVAQELMARLQKAQEKSIRITARMENYMMDGR